MPEQFPSFFVRQEDYQLSQDETMGTKSKFWFEHPELGRCLYKHIRPNTGEDWAEKVAEQIGELLGLPHAKYELAETWEGNYGTVSLNFIPQGGTLIHGNEILTPLVPNYPTYETYNASQHTIDVVLNAIESSQVQLPPEWTALEGIETARDLFIGYIFLDALIGNGDKPTAWLRYAIMKTGVLSEADKPILPTYFIYLQPTIMLPVWAENC